MKTTEDFKDVLVPKGRDPAISARDGTIVHIPVSQTGRRDDTEPMIRHGTIICARSGTMICIRHGTIIRIRDGTDIHIREGTGLGSRNERKPATGKPPEWEWYAQSQSQLAVISLS